MQVLLTYGNSNTGYNYCYCNDRNGKLAYDHHEGGAKSRWMDVIRDLNTNQTNPSYITSAGDCFGVRRSRKPPPDP